MDYSNALMAGSSAVQTISDLSSAWAQSQALRAQGEFNQAMAEINQRFANERAKDVMLAGEEQVAQTRRRARATIGSQRAAAAAQGIAVDDGSAGDATADTALFSEDEVITQRNNAWREAFGIRQQAQTALTSARMQKRGNDNAADATLLGGGLNALAGSMKTTSYGLKAWSDLKRTPSPGAGNAVVSPVERDYTLGANVEPLSDDTSFSSTFFKSGYARRKGGVL